MSDIDMFSNQIQRKSYKSERQDRFEQKVLLKLMRGLESTPGVASRIQKYVGEEFNMIWLMRTYPDFPVRLMTYKTETTIELPAMVKWPKRSMVYKELEKARENYGETGVGIIYSSTGDQMPEMILHDQCNWDLGPDNKWRIELPELELVIESLDDFIKSVKFNAGWQLNEL